MQACFPYKKFKLKRWCQLSLHRSIPPFETTSWSIKLEQSSTASLVGPSSWSKAQQHHYNHLHWRWQTFARASAEAKPEGVGISYFPQHTNGPMGLSI
jgi:hypothetical protein